MKQRIADALQIAGALGLTVAATITNSLFGLLVGSALAICAGVVVERS